jgi:outer membrane biosynthesis protein TonB
MEERIFYIAIILSLVFHVALLTRITGQVNVLEQMKKKNPEMVYEAVRPAPVRNEKVSEISVQQTAAAARVEVPATTHQETSREIPLFRKTGPEVDTYRMYERQPEKLKGSRVTKEVVIPVLKSEKIDTPTYVSYYQIVRDRIRERAYVNYVKLSIGEVYITFVIRSDGSLDQMQIIESRTIANDFLRQVGERSVREAAPFPPFPAELNYPELTFNIAISFQYRED